MFDVKNNYYEQPSFWNEDYRDNPTESQRLISIWKCIPQCVNNILDVGCGDGSFLHLVADKADNSRNIPLLVGIDKSREALKHVRTSKAIGNVAELPFQNSVFDLVTCLEVMEHLPHFEFEKAIEEIKRVSKKYLILSVPYREDLRIAQVRCPECFCVFNPWFHVRDFDKNRLRTLFGSEFKLTKLFYAGPWEEYFDIKIFYIFVFIRNYLANQFPKMPATAICPQCGFQRSKPSECVNPTTGNVASKKSLLGQAIAPFVKKKRKRRWVIAVYRRIDG